MSHNSEAKFYFKKRITLWPEKFHLYKDKISLLDASISWIQSVIVQIECPCSQSMFKFSIIHSSHIK